MPTFGERLRLLREEKKLTQIDLAKTLSLANSTISQYEANKRDPDTSTLLQIADYFGVTLDYLLGRTNIRSVPRVAENRAHYGPETQAAHRTDDPTDELPEEARKTLEEFKTYILNKYKKK